MLINNNIKNKLYTINGENNEIIESRFEIRLNLVNFCIMKNSSNKNLFFFIKIYIKYLLS